MAREWQATSALNRIAQKDWKLIEQNSKLVAERDALREQLKQRGGE